MRERECEKAREEYGPTCSAGRNIFGRSTLPEREKERNAVLPVLRVGIYLAGQPSRHSLPSFALAVIVLLCHTSLTTY